MFARAIGRGEIPADIDIEVAIDLLSGPVYHRLFDGKASTHRPIRPPIGGHRARRHPPALRRLTGSKISNA